MGILARVLLCLLLPFPPIQAQGEPGAGGSVPCDECRGQGCFPCRKHGKVLLPLEEAVEVCSVAAACKDCAGALRIDCKICRNEGVERELERRRDLARRWLGERRKAVDEVTRNPEILHGRSAHVDLAFAVKPLTVGKEKVDTHRLMHLYLQRTEDLRATFLEVFGLAEKDFSARLQLYLFQDPRDHRTIAPRVTGGGGSSSAGQKLMGVDAVWSVYHDPRTMPGDEGLYRSLVHNVTHLLLSNMEPAVWLGNRKHGWIDEGVAHWFEEKVTGKCTNYCYEEVGVAPGSGFKGGRWRVPVRKMVEANRLKPFAVIAELNTDQLSWEDHAQVFAQVDFLMQTHGGKAFAGFVRAVKKGAATRDALQRAFGLSPLDFDGALRTWVRATYPMEENG
ncbi:MAG: hypothetical protein IT458_06170 [Planctomycetes bacterium]|nr:hypothetical protein [Planctomycetota bacterium]